MTSTALITGSSGGIGKAIAIKLAPSYKTLFLHYCSSKDQAVELAEELTRTTGTACIPVYADLSSSTGIEELISQTGRSIDALILNSGSSHYGLFQDMKEDEFHKMLALNLTSPMLLTKQFIPYMLSQKRGTVIAISSVWGENGASCEAVYSAAKGGMNTFIRSIAKELGPNGIRANAVAPGAVDTAMMLDFTEEDITELKDSIPAGRLGRPEEIADAVHFLSGESSSYINGHILAVNGAWYT
ncbi:elongation factor P 5-aminopentanone reductase [Fictibacillus iocasae]|uniref:Elongation factor P 5-aminopentanone reductase n=1 Tax=Fictibacillus iocasae TaxID=2715437 RepID=A0ABW2NQW5_9BACL